MFMPELRRRAVWFSPDGSRLLPRLVVDEFTFPRPLDDTREDLELIDASDALREGSSAVRADAVEAAQPMRE